jgi:hypothetical protein
MAWVRSVSAQLALPAWIGAVLLLDALPLPAGTAAEVGRQLVLGTATWTVLVVALRGESRLVRTQTAVVVVLATVVEYTFSPLLQAYTYRIGTVPLFVPPGHGLVYLAAWRIGHTPFVVRRLRFAVVLVAVGCSAWAVAALAGPRHDVLGAFWGLCLLGFLVWGRQRGLYVGAFLVVSALELAGTALGTWAWAGLDPVLGVIGQGNPPSGAAGGYGWFDLYAGLLAPRLLSVFGASPSTSSTASCSIPLVATAEPDRHPSTPSSPVNRPPASTTTGTSAAMS